MSPTPANRAARVLACVALVVSLCLVVGMAAGFDAVVGTADRQCEVISALRSYVIGDTAPLHVPEYVEPGVKAFLVQRDAVRRQRRAEVLRAIPAADC